MGYTTESQCLVSILLLALSITISFVFSGKLKIIRYLFWVISSLLLIYLILIIPLNWYYNKKESKYLTGMYVLDTDSSKYSNLDIHKFSSVIMKVNDDNTFTINKATPFFPEKSGKWSYWVDGDLAIMQSKFDNTENSFPISQTGSYWEFQSSFLVGGKKGDRIIFRHK